MSDVNLPQDYSDYFQPEKHNLKQLKTGIIKHLRKANKTAQIIELYIQDTECDQIQVQKEALQKYNHSEDYYKLYFQAYNKNEISMHNLNHLMSNLKKLQMDLQQADKQYKLYVEKTKLKNRKKHRRVSSEIQKDFQCPYDNCYKVYGSDVSLNLHIKIKHGGGNKSERDKLAICQAQKEGYAIPKMSIVLPPGFLEDYRKKFTTTTNK